MATMQALFLGVFFVVICNAVPVEHSSVKTYAEAHNFDHPFTGAGPFAGAGLQTGATHYPFADFQTSATLADAGLQTSATPTAVLRARILSIASAEIGVREATGNNDGKRVAEYLRYTGLGKGHEWCAAFVCWCYGQAGLPAPRNPWSPALFPKARTYWKKGTIIGDTKSIHPSGASGMSDIFGIYGQKEGRINHVGLVKFLKGNYLLTIEGNVGNRVQSKRRHLSTIYTIADWITR